MFSPVDRAENRARAQARHATVARADVVLGSMHGCGRARRWLGREDGGLSVLPLRLGNVESELARELGPPARIVAVTPMARSVRRPASRSTFIVVASQP